jgi:serine-type D-Ala-D-Ala endopeptidase (penicillin-binding protein 7)
MGGSVSRKASSTPVPTSARSRLGLAVGGLFLSAALLVPGELSVVSLAGLGGTGTAEAAGAAAKTSRKSSTAKKSGSRKRVGSTKRASAKKSTRKRGKRARRGTVRATNGVNARAALIVDARTGEVLFDKNSGMRMPIASLTKLMTAMVLLESKPELSRRVMVTREDLAGSGRTQLRAGEVLTMRDLLHLALLSSDNAATKSLVRNSDLSPEEFLARMNRKSQVMGLSNTRFVEFTGLSEQNVSTATEYAQILKTAGNEPLIQHITTLPDYTFRSSKGNHHLVNTNRLCRYGIFDVRGGKTGFINEAGYCLATWVSTRTRDVISVVLGAPSNSARFAETRRLIDRWAVAPVAKGAS